jgi:hypothetical protein
MVRFYHWHDYVRVASYRSFNSSRFRPFHDFQQLAVFADIYSVLVRYAPICSDIVDFFYRERDE